MSTRTTQTHLEVDAVALKNRKVETPDLVPHFSLRGLVLAAEAPWLEQRLQERVQVLFRAIHRNTHGGTRHPMESS